MANIRGCSKRAGEYFWRYLGSLDGEDSVPQVLDPDNVRPVQNAEDLLEKQLYTLFSTMHVKTYAEGSNEHSLTLEEIPTSTETCEFVTLVGRVDVDDSQL